MKKFLSFIMVALVTLTLVACGKDDKKDVLKINFAVGNNNRTLTYNNPNPLTMPDGKVIKAGDLKPMWQYIEGKLNIDISDVTTQDQKAADMISLAAATGFTDAHIYGGNSVAQNLMAYGADDEHYFINLLDHMDKLPNFKKYLEDYPAVKSEITAHDGGIYHIPYVAELDNYARVFAGRTGWVELLLDSALTALEAETATLGIEYNGFWGVDIADKRHDSNVITLQNATAVGGKLSRNAALTALVNYIKTTYPDFADQPSKLFVGSTAKYDIDELVALWRVIKLSPNTLSKDATGTANPDAIIAPYLFRQSSYREDLLRLANYFNGQRVFGSDSYGAKFYLDDAGVLQYSYAEESFLELLDYFKAFYAEGLIHQEFSETSVKTNFRNEFFSKDKVANHKQFGFMTFDWIASTTAASDNVKGILPPVTKLNGGTTWDHYVENARSIKPDGWAIASHTKGKTLDKALALFDYMFSAEGNDIQNYGIPANLEAGEKFTVAGVDYPKLNEWFLAEAKTRANGDASTFVRDFIGANMPVGYQKQIGFEYQYTNDNGMAAWKLYNDAEVISSTYKKVDSPYFSLVPPVFSLNVQDSARLAQLGIGEAQTDAIFLYITDAESAEANVAALRQLYVEAGIVEYVNVFRGAYARIANK